MSDKTPQVITFDECVNLLESASAVIIDNMVLADINIDRQVAKDGEADEIWLDHEHEDEEGLVFRAAFDKRPQTITITGSVISLLDVDNEVFEIQLLRPWEPVIGLGDPQRTTR